MNEPAWIAWYKNHRLPVLRTLPGVLDYALFAIVTAGKLHEPAYNYITILELDSEDTAHALGADEPRTPDSTLKRLDPETKPFYELAREVRVNSYRPISKHWSFDL
jgi:hypothetical protein